MRELADGGCWSTIAGQPTDDSGLALQLVKLRSEHGTYDSGLALAAYQQWLNSGPFDCGATIRAGLRRHPNFDSQVNGALVRISPPSEYSASLTRWQPRWVLIAIRNALWQLLHAPNLARSVVDTVMRGGDTDTNAAICGALLGAIYGIESMPSQWLD